ncbi:hypothetical protein ACVR0A_06530 [Streptococcus downei]|uniref:Uncharacterized protein n=1 Tax=Streptococcus downei MFe28 TaxID=764290 RepID=A0A380JF84_STRDO|nr:hypothetical protein [Streptococcus downei]SUN36741.1 Uncharacterised protein [Streptococcus downei MFe28]
MGKKRKHIKVGKLIPFLNKLKLWLKKFWWTLIVASLIVPVIKDYSSHVMNNHYDNSKEIVISDNDISNINNKTGMVESVTTNPKIFSNFILNSLTVENKRATSQAITKIELYGIRKKPYKIKDLQYDGGFFEDNQKFVLLTYNNGNEKAATPSYHIKYIAYEKGLSKDHLLKDQVIKKTNVNSGDVKSLAIENFEQFRSEFETNDKLENLNVVITNNKGAQVKNLNLIVRYDRNKKKFVKPQVGSTGPGVGDVPLLNLTSNVKQQSASCSQILKHGANNVGFTVLVDKTCQLEYKVKIESGKKIITNNKSYNVIMRVPVYTQENSGFYGDFYEFLLKHNTELDKPISYNKKLISEFDKKLVFDKYKAARKFSKAQI